jgi:hypothetical protein
VKRIAVFCGANIGNNDIYKKEAYTLGQYLSAHNIGVVFGGGKIGMMGAVADGAMDNGGEVIGVIPDFLRSKEIAHTGITEMIEVDSMHVRKTKMYELTDGIIIMPGGFGTLDELFEILTWGQLGLHTKPIAILNIQGYFDHLLAFVDNMVNQGFLKQENADMLLVSSDMDVLLTKMRNYKAPATGKWIKSDQV